MPQKVSDKVFDLMSALSDKTKVDISEMRFDPEGSGYDKKTADELIEMWPLTIPKPDRYGEYEGETIEQQDAFEAWVWHEDVKDWEPHGGSLDPRTGMLLKGMKHSTINLTLEEEERLGTNKFEYNPLKGRYFSVPK